MCKLNDYSNLIAFLTLPEYKPLQIALKIKFGESENNAISEGIVTKEELEEEYIMV
jgi:hypothetical protein